MKRIYTSAIAVLLLTLGAHAQSVVLDTTTMGTGYANQLFYSLANGDVKSNDKTDWDLAFTTKVEDAAILANHGAGVMVFEVPSADTANWSTLDTTGMHTWNMLVNNDTFWSRGAFNKGENLSLFNYGWGAFSLSDFNVHNANKLFVLQLGNGDVKKLWIKEKIGMTDHYIFRIANIDNTSDLTKDIDASATLTTRNFVYYSIGTDAVFDVEPAKNSWDILFQQYMTILHIPQPLPYLVAGAWSNPNGVQVAEVDNVTFSSASYPGATALDTMATEIGYDWKSYNMSTNVWDIHDSMIYFVKAVNGDIWKLHFTGFGGGSTGDVMMGKQKLISASAGSLNKDVPSAVICPNPSASVASLVCSLHSDAAVQISILDLTGRMISNETMAGKTGLNVHQIDFSSLANGTYLMRLEQNGNAANVKFIIAR